MNLFLVRAELSQVIHFVRGSRRSSFLTGTLEIKIPQAMRSTNPSGLALVETKEGVT